ncbi:RNA polymerase factor sigma-54 [Kiloniella laminariae]|uniref:RNA polymerase sigma-54 factor n=1 Tax=Kiloniella laminariae TaxID=454162 RepID=A0ABT4LMD5_9PROT|nr:RNA polymerase factor sigma-54 [Kiloniella laminariae]MCZ4281536.1 RNA polymerase factor sigma-54 [Kiloniella laminariae]
MAVSQRLELRQSQSLVMTPQLQQAIKLLQLSNIELAEYVQRELEQNPLLDRDDGTGNAERQERETGDLHAAAEASSGNDSNSPDSLELGNAETLPDSNQTPLDTDFDSYYDSSPDNQWNEDSTAFSSWGPGGNTRFDDESFSLENRLEETVTLSAHLREQLVMEIDDPTKRIIGLHLIDHLDESGYMKADLGELAEQLGCQIELIESVLQTLQTFDPSGICARDLAECLAIQLREKNRLDPVIQALLDNLDLLAKRDLAGLRKVCHVDDEDITDMIAEIRALNPRPAASFDTGDVESVIPEVIVRPDRAGGWHVELNTDALPKVLINNHYYNNVSQLARTKEEKTYISEQIQSANWLVKALHQRATTVMKVASEIVRQQEKFLQKGVQSLRPLTLKDIAEVIEMHESTVSRVTSNKYMVTPRGTYEMKYFFTSSIGGDDGNNHSSEAVRDRIKNLIDQEDSKKILSDDALVTRLKQEGIDIARRTVAKYREALGISSSVQRRREKSLSL